MKTKTIMLVVALLAAACAKTPEIPPSAKVYGGPGTVFHVKGPLFNFDPDTVLSLPVLDELPTENRYAHPAGGNSFCKKMWASRKEGGETDIDGGIINHITLPNGSRVGIRDLVNQPRYTVSSSGEKVFLTSGSCVYIVNPWGEKLDSLYSVFHTFYSDAAVNLVINESAKRIFVRESFNGQPAREHDLKCTKDECAFFTDNDCLYAPEDTETLTQIKQELRKDSNQFPHHRIFRSAMAGDPESIELFLDRDRISKYINLERDESHSHIRKTLIDYGKRCFPDITWPDK